MAVVSPHENEMRDRSTYRIAVDIGGTFTDIVAVGSDGSLLTNKVLSTPDDYARGILDGLHQMLARAGVPPGAVRNVVHGTTVATNSILEGRGARTALITTAGFRDVLELRRIRIPRLYDLFFEKPAPLVPRRLRFEVRERLGPDGGVETPLDDASARAAADRARAAGAEAVAVCLLHSYANPAHERRVAAIARAALPDAFVCCSADILPEIREYERTSTTVINAYVGPTVQAYLRSLSDRLRRASVAAPLLIMQSNGGVMTAAAAMGRPAYIVESGPAAGVIASAHLARLAGYPNVITLDMGGTTAKASMIERGEVAVTSEYEAGAGITLSSRLVKGGGHALKLPMIDLSEIGAGGGSIVSVQGGLIRVGPQSAGAAPGPACYDAGGAEPTLTDAHLVLGYLAPDGLAGGTVPLNPARARAVIAERVAGPLNLSLLEAAYGVHAIASALMTRAVKAVSTFRGRDPRDCVLVAFGGNGPLCGVEMARSLQIRRVLVPPQPGLFSAFGLLLANIEHQLVHSIVRRVDRVEPRELAALYADLEEQARAVLAREGCPPDRVVIRRQADLRYAGQAYELTVPAPAGPVTAPYLDALADAFGAEHQRTYGHRATAEPIDLICIRVIAGAAGDGANDPGRWLARDGAAAAAPGAAERTAYFGPEHGTVRTPVRTRADLGARAVRGPVIIADANATCVVPPGCAASVDAWGNAVIDVPT